MAGKLSISCLLLSFFTFKGQTVNADLPITEYRSRINDRNSKASAFEFPFFIGYDLNLEYSMSNSHEDNKVAVVLTFDDWSPGHLALVIPELKKRNINATFL